jgi:hypothetical protein
MTRIVVPDKRYSNWARAKSRSGWVKIAEYNGKDIPPSYTIPNDVWDHWKGNKDPFGYASFKGIEKKALSVVSLAKAGLIYLAVNRWGQVIGYKIRTI